MGNKLISSISENIKEMKNLIQNFEYERARDLYEQIKNEITRIDKVETVKELITYLLEKFTEKKVVSDLIMPRLSDPFALSAEGLLRRFAKKATTSPIEGIPDIPSDLFTITLKDDEQDS